MNSVHALKTANVFEQIEVSVSRDGRADYLVFNLPVECAGPKYRLVINNMKTFEEAWLIPDEKVGMTAGSYNNRSRLAYNKAQHNLSKADLKKVSLTKLEAGKYPDGRICIPLALAMSNEKPTKGRKMSQPVEKTEDDGGQQRAVPKYLRLLKEAVKSGNTAGRLIGCSGGTVTSALKDNDVNLAFEQSAKSVYLERYAPSNDKQQKFFLIGISGNDAEFIKTCVERAGGSFTPVGK